MLKTNFRHFHVSYFKFFFITAISSVRTHPTKIVTASGIFVIFRLLVLFFPLRSSNLNGVYLDHAYGQRMMGEVNGEPAMVGTGIEWYPYRQRQYSFKKVTMKIKPSVSTFLG